MEEKIVRGRPLKHVFMSDEGREILRQYHGDWSERTYRNQCYTMNVIEVLQAMATDGNEQEKATARFWKEHRSTMQGYKTLFHELGKFDDPELIRTCLLRFHLPFKNREATAKKLICIAQIMRKHSQEIYTTNENHS